MDSQSTQSSTFSESSKTTSSRSKGSRDAEFDLTKDNAASPIDLECHIQEERITKILNVAIYKTKLALSLPYLVKEHRTLAGILSEQHMDDLLFIFEQYENPLFSSSLLNISALEDIQGGDVTLKNRLNPELGHLIYILNSYPQIKPKVEEIVEKMRATIVSNSDNNNNRKDPTVGFKYLLELEHFRELMIVRMQTTAAEELLALIDTRKLEASNDNLVSKITEYTTCLKEESKQFEQNIQEKTNTIARLEKELFYLKQDSAVKERKKIVDSDRQMVLATRAHAVRKEILKEEEVEFRETYDRVLHSHLLEEKNLRTRRLKVEKQLQSWLQTYDGEMADRQLELEEFNQKHEDEVKLHDELTIKLAEQDKEYEVLMAEKEGEYHEEMAAKLEKFVVEHAVKVIQIAWRDVVANRNEKKKLRKLQKKMQAAAEAAAAAAAAAEKKRLAEEKKLERQAKAEEKRLAKEAKLEAAAAAAAAKN